MLACFQLVDAAFSCKEILSVGQVGWVILNQNYGDGWLFK